MGERQEQPFQLSFNGRLRVDFQGARVTSDGGLLLVRELDERLGFGELIERHLTDGRGKNTQLPLTDLVRESICSRFAGYKDVNDAERLSPDPAFPFRLCRCQPDRPAMSAADFDDERWGTEKCLRNRLDKRHFWGVAWPRNAKRAPSGRGWRQRGPKLDQTLPREAGWSIRGVEIGRGKTEIPE